MELSSSSTQIEHQMETESVPEDNLSSFLKVELETSPSLLEAFIETDNKVLKYQCPICNKKFKNKEKAKNHADSHNVNQGLFAGDGFRCPECNIHCENVGHLKSHVEKHKKTTRPRKSSTRQSRDLIGDLKQFICESCAKGFKTKQQLQTHYLVHIDIKPFTCDICQKAFKLKQQLHNHSKVHDDNKPFVCELCEKGFKLKQHFENHSKTHSNERPFECNFCEKAFKFKQHLQIHNRVHDDLRPFDCSFCGKAFKLKQQMQVHLKVHVDERPFQCDICPKSFKFKQQLHVHSRIHSKKLEKVVNGFFEETLFAVKEEASNDGESNKMEANNFTTT